MPPGPGPARLLAFDGLRAACALAVFLHHHGPSIRALDHPVLQGLFHAGFLGVTPFFVLSGFLITHRYINMQRSGWRPYLVRRAARILPLLLLVVSLTFASLVRQEGMECDDAFVLYVMNITTIKGWFDDLKFSGIVQTWSITTEMAFYLAAPILFIGLRRWGGRFLIGLPLVLMIAGAAIVLLLDGRGPWGLMRSMEFMFAFTFFGRATEFVVGMAVAWHVRNTQWRSGRGWITVFGVGLTVLTVIHVATTRWTYESANGVWLVNLAWPVLGLGPLFYGLLTENSVIRRALGLPWMVAMGKASYAFYLIHLGVICTAIQQVTQSLVATLFLLFVMAWSMNRLFEEPLVRWAKNRWPEPAG